MRPTCLNPKYHKNIEQAYDYQTHSCLHLLKNKPQMNADERRFINLNIQHSPEVYQRNSLIKSHQNKEITQSIDAIVFVNFASFALRILRFPIIFLFENHTELKGHREKWQTSVYSVVDCLYNLDQRRIYGGRS